MPPRTLYTKSGNVSIAYQVTGDGPIDLVFAPGWVSNVEYAWENPDYARLITRLSSFSRFIRFDKRGTGLSDRDVKPSTLEQRVDDIRAVMDAVGSERAALLGMSEGGNMSVMFTATHPERSAALVLFGCFARAKWAPDYPWGSTQQQRDAFNDLMEKNWGDPVALDEAAPSVANDEAARSWFGAYLRHSGSPSAVRALSDLNFQLDMRAILPSVRVPTLVLHRKGDRWYSVAEAEYLAEHIPGAKLVILPGDDHIIWWGDQERVVGEVQEFLTGTRAAPPTERVLLTVLVTDIVGSTQKAAEMGDLKWKDVLQLHDAAVRRELGNFDGQEINTTGDGFVLAFTGPTRAIQCSLAIKQRLERLGLGMRAGLHTGECERRGHDLSGLAVHVASRITSKASSNDILVSNTVRDLVVGSDIRFAEMGRHSLRGVPGEWPLYSVVQ
ncbi:MAG TPA: adenylate/guanylate cyclase domain-containing protein [Aestuariivirgaceae bacterium]|jgi:pimeloyl-ACP methyl ester carboxylesterase